jgi:GMP synthase (glutamine-hydrolysing)
LARLGYEISYVDAWFDEVSDVDPVAPDLLIVLGGPVGVYEAYDYPFLADEIRLVERRLATKRPFLGICLGAQIMAAALGARVYRGLAEEIGWTPITLTEAGRSSPVSAFAKPAGAVLHWHGDTFDLPEGTVRLASSAAYENQAIAYGQHALGLQFHGEVTARGLRRWFIGHTRQIRSTPSIGGLQRLKDTTDLYAPRLASAIDDFLLGWDALHAVDARGAVQV